MYIVAHNLVSMNASRQLNIANKNNQKSIEKLSSGYRINRAADDAAGLSISEKMRSQIRGLNQGADNIEDGISYAQVADGALEEVHSMLQRINELAIQAANGTNSDNDRKAINDEITQLKTEMDRIFETTTFNEKKIWPESSIDRIPVWVGTVPIQAVRITTPGTQSFSVNNASYDKIASGSYKISADDTGVQVSWVDYDGDKHKTEIIDWTTLEANNYSFQIGDYFEVTDTELFDSGKPIFDFKMSMSVADEANIKDIIASIDGTYMSSSASTSMKGRFEDATGAEVKYAGVNVNNASINYAAAYASKENANISGGETGFDFESGSDSFSKATVSSSADGNLDIIPTNNSTDVGVASSSTDTWSFTFDIEGIGRVTAVSDNMYYYAKDKDTDGEKIWWTWEKDYKGNMYQATKYRYPDEYGEGTLGTVMAALTGDDKTATPGLLNKNEGGMSNSGGYIYLSFSLTSANTINYGENASTNSIGSLTLRIDVSNSDDEESVLNKINTALNSATVVDLYTTSSIANSSKHYVSASNTKSATVDHDVYELEPEYNDVHVNIHAGPSTEDKINMSYKCLRVDGLGMKDTNVLTEDSATRALDEVSNAISIVSEQRSRFGAYQNRMEHAKAMNDNTEENTTAAELRIRDANMAEEMVRYSKNNILQQAGQTMLAQANQSNEGVLSLLIG